MKRQDAENIITDYLKPIIGFALKRCKSMQDAEDLSQEIVLKAFRALLAREDVADAGRFIWTVAHNALSNYYRDTAKSMVGVSIDEVSELIADPASFMDEEDDAETLHRLQTEIAYLSGLQRRIVIAYYFENRRQADIAEALGIPLGTVKWHLFEAKKELKRGMDTMRKASDLKFNPVSFQSISVNGKIGTKAPGEILRSTLAQNICYCVRNKAKTVNEISEALGVSPVYVETEAAYLEENGFLQAQRDKYIVNFIISEASEELLLMQNDMYRKAAGLFANDLYDELTASGLPDSPGILCGQTDGAFSQKISGADRNFLLWTLIPFIAAGSGGKLLKESISFEEAATLRPDGGHNIVNAVVVPDQITLPVDYVSMKNWCGPMWNTQDGLEMWQIDSEWSRREPARERNVSEEMRKTLALYEWEQKHSLSGFDYAWLAERGYLKTVRDDSGSLHSSWQLVVLANAEIRRKLLAVGERIREKYRDDFAALKAPYEKAVLESVPAHLRKMKAYELQFVFYADGWFLLHCIMQLLENGKLREPAEDQSRALTTLIAPVI